MCESYIGKPIGTRAVPQCDAIPVVDVIRSCRLLWVGGHCVMCALCIEVSFKGSCFVLRLVGSMWPRAVCRLSSTCTRIFAEYCTHRKLLCTDYCLCVLGVDTS